MLFYVGVVVLYPLYVNIVVKIIKFVEKLQKMTNDHLVRGLRLQMYNNVLKRYCNKHMETTETVETTQNNSVRTITIKIMEGNSLGLSPGSFSGSGTVKQDMRSACVARIIERNQKVLADYVYLLYPDLSIIDRFVIESWYDDENGGSGDYISRLTVLCDDGSWRKDDTIHEHAYSESDAQDKVYRRYVTKRGMKISLMWERERERGRERK